MYLPLAHCAIRSWRPSDAVRLAVIANDRSIWMMLRDRFPHPYSQADAEAFIAVAATEVPECNFAITVEDIVVGSIGCIRGDDIARVSAELGYWLGADARGRGLATVALRGFVGWLWANSDLQHLRASVFLNNPESARVLEKGGFTLAHIARKAAIKDGRIMDEWYYVRVRGDDPSDAREGAGET